MICIDLVLLPYRNSKETIGAYSLIQQGKSNPVTSYRFYTNEGIKFSLEKDFIQEEEVILQRTMLFKQIVNVKTSKRDYSSLLSSGFNGFSLVFMDVLAFSSAISLVKLQGDTELSKNQYQNYILFNRFMVFCIVTI